jgi:antitoxin component YwqK of YwqJK toxin-antitoxin module
MSQLVNHKLIKQISNLIFQEKTITPFIAHIIKSYIYEEVINYDKDGNIVDKYIIRYGVKEGLYQSWYPNGQKHIEKNFKKGLKDGLIQSWHQNGHKNCECSYKKNKREGTYKWWYDNGQKQEECNYKEGNQEGLYQWWDSSGRFNEKKWS